MTTESFFKRWYETFAFNVPKKIMTDRVLTAGNLPWHIFTWGEVESIDDEDALNHLFEQHFDAVIVLSGFPDDFSKIRIIKSKRKFKKLLKTHDDLYITPLDFSWTFVKTHESGLGPYFKIREKTSLISYNVQRTIEYYQFKAQDHLCKCDTCKNYYARI